MKQLLPKVQMQTQHDSPKMTEGALPVDNSYVISLQLDSV